jgi:hypothetical protein
VVPIVAVWPYVVVDRSTVHLRGWSWLGATLDLELSRDTLPCNPVGPARIA